jgi:hypothetical protein
VVPWIFDPPVTGAIAVFIITWYLPGDIDPIGEPPFIQAPRDGVEGTENLIIVEGDPDLLDIIYIYILYKNPKGLGCPS